MTAAMFTPSCRITDADMDAAATLRTLYAYRYNLYDAQRAGARPPVPPALSADALVNAYGAAMNRYGAEYVTFAAWYAAQQTPQPRGRYFVTGHME